MRFGKRQAKEEAKPRTIGDFIDAAARCSTEEQAREFVAAEVAETLRVRPELVPEEARAIVMQNVGYISGYFDRGKAAEILQLFGARHPIFGAMENWPKTPEETLALGQHMGARLKGA